jgi:hypothetical protein
MSMETFTPWFVLYVEARHEKNVGQVLKSRRSKPFCQPTRRFILIPINSSYIISHVFFSASS